MELFDDMDAPLLEPDRQYYYMNKCTDILYEKKLKLGRNLTYNVTTFGCQMNSHDSEKLKGILEAVGYQEVEDEDADIIIYNTCTVRENANLKLYGHLGHLKNLKKKKQDMLICLCGCMMQEPTVVELIQKKYGFVDIVFGTHNIYKLSELIFKQAKTGAPVFEILEKAENIVEALPQKRKYSFKSGVNIMYGCNNFCTYCIVPYVRGREHSREHEEIINEIEMLAKKGVKEVMLLGQNVNSYAGKVSFPELLRLVCRVEGIERVRFMTSHPKDLSDELITVMKEEKKLCRHIHLPVQAGSSRILKAMNRRYTKEQYLMLVEKIRNAMPDISITTDIMVGFPGETEEDFLETMDVVEKVKYDQAFTFIYSMRTGTPAAAMEQVPEEAVKDRFSRLLNRVNEISNQQIARFTGKIKEILVEEVNHQDDSLLTGRTQENITVHFKGDKALIGQLVPVMLKECKGFYYIGERIEEDE